MVRKLLGSRIGKIVAVGGAGCLIAFGIRTVVRKPIHGTWLGFTYYEIEGKMVRDEAAGEYLIRLNEDGTYEENGNLTSGVWTRKGDVLTLNPTKFIRLTPEEHRKKNLTSKGKVSVTLERLLTMKMKPMAVIYDASRDNLIYEEPTVQYVYERTQ